MKYDWQCLFDHIVVILNTRHFDPPYFHVNYGNFEGNDHKLVEEEFDR